ncbi:MAG: hypothetical protein ABI085_05965 [Gemmatimonadaceae bacterium]
MLHSDFATAVARSELLGSGGVTSRHDAGLAQRDLVIHLHQMTLV